MTTTTETPSLFEITRERAGLESILEELGGELTPEIEDALKINRDQLERKGESYVFIMEQLHAYIEFNKRYKEKAEQNIKRAEASIERLKSNLLAAAKTFGPFEAGIHRIGLRKSTAVIIDDESAIPDAYLVKKVVVNPDKKRIGEALKSGVTIPGASLVTNQNLKIS